MVSKKLIIRILVYLFVAVLLLIAGFLYYFGDINKLKTRVEKNLKDQLTCTVKLGDLQWDWEGLKLGVTTSKISMYDKDNNIVLQGGPTRFVWQLKSIITGAYSHFYSIESTDLYLNAIRYQDGIWNLIKIFPPGPPPKVDNLELHNSIIFLVDELNPTSKTVLYKDLNVSWIKKAFSKARTIDLTTRVGSLISPSFLRVKGKYTERKDFDWNKSQFDLFIHAKRINLANLHGFFANISKDPEIKKIRGEFTGILRLNKKKGEKSIKVRSRTITNNFFVEFKTKNVLQTLEIPVTDLLVQLLIDKQKIYIKNYKSNIGELTYELSGFISNWSKSLPEADITLKTNKFNFKSIKPYLPLSLLPADTRQRIEPINDDGYVELDLKLKGPVIEPKYHGTVLLSNFNLTAESGFVTVINGLEGKLTLDDELLKIDYLNIPIKGSPLVLKGEVDNENAKTSFNISGKSLDIKVLHDLVSQAGLQSQVLNQVETKGNIDLNLDIFAEKNNAPEIKGKLTFYDAGVSALTEEPLEIKNVFGDLLLDGAKVTFNKVNGLINNENFSINGSFSLKEDETVNLAVSAEHLKVIRYLLSFFTAKTPFRPIAKTISGEFSNLNLNIAGTFSKPVLDGMVLINNVSFSLPNLKDKISNISGNLKFEGADVVIEDLNGIIQNADFGISGYIENLFSGPKPHLRLVTGDIELGSFWNYIKEQLKTSSLNAQAKELETLEGIASVDIFLHPDALLGNIYFKDGKIKYKPLPFGLNNLAGRLVIGEKNISLFGFMGSVNEGNDFNCDLTVFNYLNPNFVIEGMVVLDAQPPALVKAINPNFPNTLTCDGLIPTLIDFNVSFPVAKVSFYSTLNEMLMLDFAPYISKPTDKGYVITGNIEFDSENMDLFINEFNIKSNKLSITTNGSIKNVTSKNPDLMLSFNTDEPTGIFMIIEPITPLMTYKIWGMIDLNGSISGIPSMYTITTNGMVSDIRMPELLGKKLKASDGIFNICLDNEKGQVSSKINNVTFASLNAKSVSFSGQYLNPVVYLNELSIDTDPGSIFALGSYDPRDGSVNLNATGTNIELSGLGSFVFLDPEKIAGKTDFSLMLDSKGKTKDLLLANSKGNLSFSVKDGKLAQVALLQKGLKFANFFSQGIFGFNLSNVFSLFFKYQDGSFNLIKGGLNLEQGIIKANEIIYRAKDLFLNSHGFIDLTNNFIGLSVYGYLPNHNNGVAKNINGSSNGAQANTGLTPTGTPSGALSIIPDLFKKRFFIPFLSSAPPQHFKFEVKGNIKDQRKLVRRTARSFRWLKGKRLKKEYEFVPKLDNK